MRGRVTVRSHDIKSVLAIVCTTIAAGLPSSAEDLVCADWPTIIIFPGVVDDSNRSIRAWTLREALLAAPDVYLFYDPSTDQLRVKEVLRPNMITFWQRSPTRNGAEHARSEIFRKINEDDGFQFLEISDAATEGSMVYNVKRVEIRAIGMAPDDRAPLKQELYTACVNPEQLTNVTVELPPGVQCGAPTHPPFNRLDDSESIFECILEDEPSSD